MIAPTPYTLGIRRFAADGEDAHGNPVETWGDSLDWPVHAIAPGANTEPDNPNRDTSHILATIYAPEGIHPGPRDLVVLDGREYEVEGEAKQWTHGPWSTSVGGIVVELRRSEG